MTILDLIQAYWKEGLLYLFLGAGIIQISPIKISPFSWLARKIGNALNADVIKQLDDTKKSLKQLNEKFDNHVKENEREQIDECRRRILIFNEKVVADSKNITKERYDSILEDVDTYEKYCDKNPQYPNSKAVLSIENLKKDYLKRYQAKDKEE